MAIDGVSVFGQSELIAKLNKMSNVRSFLDPVLRSVAIRSTSQLIAKTNIKTGNTHRSWVGPIKLGLSSYLVTNNVKTSDGKHSIVEILDKGRGPVFPVKAKMLYIPLNNIGASKKSGAPIPKSFRYGVDYILKKSVGPYKGTNFKTDELKRARKDLVTSTISKIKEVHK